MLETSLIPQGRPVYHSQVLVAMLLSNQSSLFVSVRVRYALTDFVFSLFFRAYYFKHFKNNKALSKHNLWPEIVIFTDPVSSVEKLILKCLQSPSLSVKRVLIAREAPHDCALPEPSLEYSYRKKPET